MDHVHDNNIYKKRSWSKQGEAPQSQDHAKTNDVCSGKGIIHYELLPSQPIDSNFYYQ